jgi:hypothetical protein
VEVFGGRHKILPRAANVRLKDVFQGKPGGIEGIWG